MMLLQENEKGKHLTLEGKIASPGWVKDKCRIALQTTALEAEVHETFGSRSRV
jgi:hypothetical protein